jgi:hypothetical protein
MASAKYSKPIKLEVRCKVVAFLLQNEMRRIQGIISEHQLN